MAENIQLVKDEENVYSGNKVQPFASTPARGQAKAVKDPKVPLIWRASLAEVPGTAVLVFALDTIVIYTLQTPTNTPNLVLSVLIAFVVAILPLATYPISRGHINPIVTFAALLTGIIPVSRAAIFIVAQSVGGILGALAPKAVVNSEIERTFLLGGCIVTIVAPGTDGPPVLGLDTHRALWLEVICTFIFPVSSVWMAFDCRQAKAVGRVTTCVILGIISSLFVYISTPLHLHQQKAPAGLNPARHFGPAVVGGGHLWNGHWVSRAGPAIGCVVFALHVKMIPRR